MNSSPSFDVLAKALAALVPGAEIEVPDSGLVLTFRTNSQFIGFANSYGDALESYRVAYSAFKAAFARESRGSLEPSFVLCVKSDQADIERISSEIETDVYFCRKHVLSVGANLEDALTQLPFLPLDPIEGATHRPLTAQTFLQRHGLSAELAKHLAVPAQRSAEVIIERWLEGRYPDDDEKVHRPEKPFASVVPAVSQVAWAESLTIEGFRAYKRETTFTLGRNVTFLYGPNGFGKTSFFDAFDFALTGGVGRLSTDQKGQDAEALISHLDSKPDECRVRMTISASGQELKIVRTAKDAKQASLDGVKADRKAILSRVTGATTPSAERVENLVSLFRATHLFSQEHQELTKDMQQRSELSADIVSRMLALDDYASASAKVEAIVASIESKQKSLAKILREAEEESTEIQRSIDEMTALSPAVAVTGGEALVQPLLDLAGTLGVQIEEQSTPAATLRLVRASLDLAVAEADREQQALSNLREQASALDQMLSVESGLNADIKTARVRADELADQISNSHRELGEFKSSLANLKERQIDLSRDFDKVSWLRAHIDDYLGAQAKVAERTQALSVAKGVLSSQEERTREAEAECVYAEGMLGERSTALLSSQEAHRQISALAIDLERHSALSAQIEAALRDLERIGAITSSVALSEAAALESSVVSKDRVEALATALDQRESESNELKVLIEKMRTHIHGPECPFCGHDFGANEKLLQALERHEQSDPHAALRKELREAREEDVRQSAGLSELRREAKLLRESAAAVRLQIAAFQGELLHIEALSSSIGVVAVDGRSISEAAASLLELRSSAVDLARFKVSESETALAERQSNRHAEREALAISRAAYDAIDLELESARSLIRMIESDSNFSPQAFSISADQASVEMDRLASMQAETLELIHAAEESVTGVIRRIKTLESSLSGEMSLVSDGSAKVAEHQHAIAGIRGELGRYMIPEQDSLDVLDVKRAELADKSASAGLLLERVLAAERALDSATTAAAITSHKASLDKLKKESDAAQTMRGRHELMLAKFRSIDRDIKGERHKAVESFTTRYGPRTSVIQKRLRAVYGFEEVCIAPVDSRIAVNVSRRGRRLRPADYFSQSQQQTLLLGLFLTACSSQTWSQFGPILLDDPVAHFDDLNTYAFLDLIRGLLQEGGRQFVISTCDERFMQMALRKFKGVGEGARFYKFKSIGAEGPEVEEIA